MGREREHPSDKVGKPERIHTPELLPANRKTFKEKETTKASSLGKKDRRKEAERQKGGTRGGLDNGSKGNWEKRKHEKIQTSSAGGKDLRGPHLPVLWQMRGKETGYPRDAPIVGKLG